MKSPRRRSISSSSCALQRARAVSGRSARPRRRRIAGAAHIPIIELCHVDHSLCARRPWRRTRTSASTAGAAARPPPARQHPGLTPCRGRTEEGYLLAVRAGNVLVHAYKHATIGVLEERGLCDLFETGAAIRVSRGHGRREGWLQRRPGAHTGWSVSGFVPAPARVGQATSSRTWRAAPVSVRARSRGPMGAAVSRVPRTARLSPPRTSPQRVCVRAQHAREDASAICVTHTRTRHGLASAERRAHGRARHRPGGVPGGLCTRR